MSYPLGADPHSWSNFNHIRTDSLSLHLRIDFNRKILYGYVDHKLTLSNGSVREVHFDARHICIDDVTQLPNESPLSWTLSKHHPTLGHRLTVELPPLNDHLEIRIHYSTTPKSAAIQWFEAHQTAGQKHPFFYTQCQAILARTLVPCMDTPSVKAPYSVSLTVPPGLVAVASGTPTPGGPKQERDGWNTFSFVQKIPIPSYLIALGCGALKTASIGTRSSVWSEEELLEKSVKEYSSHTEKFVSTAEKLFPDLPYIWGTYDLLILPTAFPYGGMENPQLTFLNSSLLTGDFSLVDVVAHEIAHSWSGNLITNSTWSDFWLNEGFTMYLERILLGEVIGGEEYRKFQIFLGYKELVRVVKDMVDGGEGSWTKLRPDLVGMDPDDAFSIIPYEKGCIFLFYLENLVGGRDSILGWLRVMYGELKLKTFDSEKMKSSFLDYFSKQGIEKKLLDSIDWNTWFYGEGLPTFDPTPLLKTSYSDNCEKLLQKWLKSNGSDLSEADIDPSLFKPSQIMFVLDELVTSEAMPLKHDFLQKMEEMYKFFGTTNVEISHRFIGIGLKSKFAPAVKAAEDFLPKHGRGRYIKYLFNCLNDYDHSIAVDLWKKNSHHYHTVIVNYFNSKLSK